MKTQREPTHPGIILRDFYMKPFGITQTALHKATGYSKKQINLIVNGASRVTPDFAVRLGKAFNTSTDYWLKMQQDLDLWRAKRVFRHIK